MQVVAGKGKTSCAASDGKLWHRDNHVRARNASQTQKLGGEPGDTSHVQTFRRKGTQPKQLICLGNWLVSGEDIPDNERREETDVESRRITNVSLVEEEEAPSQADSAEAENETNGAKHVVKQETVQQDSDEGRNDAELAMMTRTSRRHSRRGDKRRSHRLDQKGTGDHQTS